MPSSRRLRRILPETNVRLRSAIAVVAAVFLFFAGALARYQLVGYATRNLVKPAALQRQRSVGVGLARGNILDRNGVPLTYPTWQTGLAIFPESVVHKEEVARFLQDELGMPEDRVESLLQSDESPAKIGLVDPAILEDMPDDPGLLVVPELIRYGDASLARHVVGHIRPNAYLNPADNVGESGIERAYQSILAGGAASWVGTIETGQGEEIPGLGLRIGPGLSHPRDVTTTLDAWIQREVERCVDSFNLKRCAVVVLDAKSGEVLAMVSRPQYDQNQPWKYLSDGNAPFVNRSISAFPPGSVFKPLVVAAALEGGYIQPDETFECTESLAVGGTVIKCGSSPTGHGKVTVEEALAYSCNSALVQIALRCPPGYLTEFAEKCGFGRITRVGLPDEASGVLPDCWSMYSGDVANFAIGQGYLTVTPLQVASFFQAVASEGLRTEPRIILGEKAKSERIMSVETARAISDGLTACARSGTGQTAWVENWGAAGKTGTAETGKTSSSTHAWFSGYFPLIDPRYVVCVFVEEGGTGKDAAAPVFAEIARAILGR